MLAAVAACSSHEPDVKAPPAPDITRPEHGTVFNTTVQRVEGYAQSHAWVDVYVDGVDAGAGARATADSFTVDGVGLGGHGAHAITARATDESGNASDHSAPVVVYVDLESPSAVIWSPADGTVFADDVIDVVGAAEGAAAVSLEVDGSICGQAVTQAGVFHFAEVVLGGEGTHTLRARGTDQIGNEGPWSPGVSVIVDASAPSRPEVTWPATGAYLTSNKVDIGGHAVGGSVVEAYVDGAFTGLTAIAGADTFRIAQVPLGGDGLKALTVAAVDSAQNRSPFSDAVVVRVDTTPPLPPTILHPPCGTVLPVPSLDVRGIADDGGVVTLWLNGQAVGEATSSGWEFSFTAVSLAEGENRLAADVRDLGGRQSDQSDSVLVHVDTAVPPLQVDYPPDGYQCDSVSVSVLGSTEAGALVEVDGQPAVVEADGSFATVTPLAPGANLILITATDAAGNEASAEIGVESYPCEPLLELFWPPDGLVTDSTAISVVGRASTWAIVEVAGAVVGQDSTGAFSARVSLSHGANLIEVVAMAPVGGWERRLEPGVVSDRAPAQPTPSGPGEGETVTHGRPRLTVSNSWDQDNDALLYSFYVWYDASMSQEARRQEGLVAGQLTTGWTVAPALSLDGRSYWWSCGVTDGYLVTWSQVRTFSVPDIGGNTPDRYLGFGDSMTAGSQIYHQEWIPAGLAYEPELEIALKAFFGEAEVVRRWVGGATVRAVLDSLSAVLTEETPAYCLLLAGTVDATQQWYSGGIPQDSLAQLKDDYRAMVAACRAVHTIPVLGTVPPLYPPFWPDHAGNIELLNEEIRAVAEEDTVLLADQYVAFLAYADENFAGSVGPLLCGDGRHISDIGYSVMAAEWFAAIAAREPGDTEARHPGDAVAERARTAR
jgi:lysophospholipase L1-like esterase